MDAAVEAVPIDTFIVLALVPTLLVPFRDDTVVELTRFQVPVLCEIILSEI